MIRSKDTKAMVTSLPGSENFSISWSNEYDSASCKKKVAETVLLMKKQD